MKFYPGLHHLLSPLHLLTNGINDGIDSTPKRAIGLLLEVMKNGSVLFSKSMKRRRHIKEHMEALNNLHTDPIVVQLFQALQYEEFCMIYNLTQSRDVVERLVFGGGDDEDDADESTCLYLARATCLTAHPPRRIKNKWKSIIFCAYYWHKNLRNFVGWAKTYFECMDWFG